MAITLDGTTGITTPGLTNTGTETLVNLTTTGNTTLGDASTDTLNVGNGGLIKDASGNVGVGVTPSAWNNIFKAVQINAQGCLMATSATMQMGNNIFYDGAYKFIGTGYASRYYQATGQHVWTVSTASGTAGGAITETQAMTLDASGNLALGFTPSPAGAGYRTMQFYDATAGGLVSSGYAMAMTSNAYLNGSTYTRGGNSYAPVKYAQFDGTHIFSRAAAAGTTITWTDIAILNSDMLYSYVGVNPSSNGATNAKIFNSSSGSGTVTLYVGNASITTVSDVRLKENIVDTQRNALELLGQLRVVDHTWNDPSDQCENNRNSRGTWMGLIAQEAQPVIPWLVNKPTADVDENGNPQYWHMDYGYSVPLLVKAIQEQQAIITTLTARITALENK